MGRSSLGTLRITKQTGLGNSRMAMEMPIQGTSKMACFMGKEFSLRRVSSGCMGGFMRAGRKGLWSMNLSRRVRDEGNICRLWKVNFRR